MSEAYDNWDYDDPLASKLESVTDWPYEDYERQELSDMKEPQSE